MGIIGGILLLVIAVVILVFGDKKMNVKGGVVLKLFSPPNYPVTLIKWVLGLFLMWVGISLIFKNF